MGIKDTILSALDQATDVTRDFAGKAAGATKNIAGKAKVKAKAGGRIAKLTMSIARERDEMKKTFLEIGKLYYDTHKDAPEGFFSQLCEEVALAEKSIAAKEAELAELKADFAGSKDAEPDVEVEFEEIVDAAAAEAEGCCCGDEAPCCCDGEEKAAEEPCCCAEEPAEEPKCCCEAPAEEAAEEPKCCGKKVDDVVEDVKEFTERAVDVIAETAEKVKDAIEDKFKGDD